MYIGVNTRYLLLCRLSQQSRSNVADFSALKHWNRMILWHVPVPLYSGKYVDEFVATNEKLHGMKEYRRRTAHTVLVRSRVERHQSMHSIIGILSGMYSSGR